MLVQCASTCNRFGEGMGIEIEHKYLVVDGSWHQGQSPTYIRQGYLAVDPAVRIRLYGEKGFITVKGRSKGNTRSEYEYEIPAKDAREMLDNLCPQPQIEKNRYLIEHQGHTWEVDVFFGANEGLVVAEIELSAGDEKFAIPPWVGEDVTENPAYTNAQLTIRPFVDWGDLQSTL